MPDLAEDLARLAAVYSRTLGVCLACPHGDWLPGSGTVATAWFDSPEYGRYGLCAAHEEAWRGA